MSEEDEYMDLRRYQQAIEILSLMSGDGDWWRRHWQEYEPKYEGRTIVIWDQRVISDGVDAEHALERMPIIPSWPPTVVSIPKGREHLRSYA